jgi:hypothetical protein
MEENNVVGLVEAKKDYTKRLIDILRPHMHEGIKSLYDASVKLCNDNGGTKDSLFVFQDKLSNIPKWSQNIVTEEYERIQEASKCDWLDKLITITLIVHAKILTIIHNKNSLNKKEITVNVPKPEFFLHKCYIQAAREFWRYPYLFSNKVNPCDYQRNMRDAENIIGDAIMETIRVQLPFKHILQECLQEEYESDSEENVQEAMSSSQQNNLRKLVRRELDNLKKKNMSRADLEKLVMDELDNLNIDGSKSEIKEEIKEQLDSQEAVSEEPEYANEEHTEQTVSETTHKPTSETTEEPTEKPKDEPTEKPKDEPKDKSKEKEKSKVKLSEKVKNMPNTEVNKQKEQPKEKSKLAIEAVEEPKQTEEERLSDIKNTLNEELSKLEENNEDEDDSFGSLTMGDLEELDDLTNIDDLSPANIFESSESQSEKFESPNFPDAPDFLDHDVVTTSLDDSELNLPESTEEFRPIEEDEHKEEKNVKTIRLDSPEPTKKKNKKYSKLDSISHDVEEYERLDDTDNELSESELPISDVEDDLDLELEDLANNVVSFGASSSTESKSKTGFKFFNDAKDE